MEEIPLLEVKHICISYQNNKKFGYFFQKPPSFAVNDVSFSVFPGECIGIVGESGSGKSSIMKAICKLIPVHTGEIYLSGTNITHMSESMFLSYRRHVQMIAQDFTEIFNPKMNVKNILLEPINIHYKHMRMDEKIQKIHALLSYVGLSNELLDRYPHELSGGQRQRISIARGLSINPTLLICDEIVSACDMCAQKQILNLLKQINQQYNISILFISHNIAVIAYLCDRIIVMKDGNVIESGKTHQVIYNPQHKYTQQLVMSVPKK